MARLLNSPIGPRQTESPGSPSTASSAEGAATGTSMAHVAASHGMGSTDMSQRALIGVLMRLKWQLWKRSYRKNIGKLIGSIIGGLYAVGGLALLVFAMLGATLWSAEGATFPLIVRGLGITATALWLLVPALAMGLDDTLDARLFALLPRRAAELQPGMFLSSFISGATVTMLAALAVVTVFEVIWLLAFGAGIGWVIAALVVLLPANLLGLVICMLLPRAWFAHAATRVGSRKGREVGGILGFIVMFAAIYGVSLYFQDFDSSQAEQLAALIVPAIGVLSWTPFGAAFAIPMDLAEGAVLVALGRALIAVATTVLLVLWWRRSLTVAMTSALAGDASSGTQKVSALVPRWMPSTALGAVVGRSLRYWRRDTRYFAALGLIPVMLVFFVALGLVSTDQRPMALGMAIFICAMTGISLSNEIGFDGPAGWVNITASVEARTNLLGRVIAMAVVISPLLLVTGLGVPLLFGWAALLPMTVLGVFGMFLTGAGVSMLVGTFLPYPTSPPGTNPMKDKSASNANALLAMAIASAGVVVPQIPAFALALWGAIADSTALIAVAGVASILSGAVVLLLGLRLGSARLDRRYPDLFQKVRAHL